MLINLIDAFTNDIFEIVISRNIIRATPRQTHVDFNFNTKLFRSKYCVKIVDLIYEIEPYSGYESLLNTFITNDRILEYKMFLIKMRDERTNLAQRQKLLKKHFKQSNIVFKTCDNLNDYCNICHDERYCNDRCSSCRFNDGFTEDSTFDSILFFNHHNLITQQHHNTIKHVSPRIKKHPYDGICIVEDCKYNKKTKCYEHILVNNSTSRMTQYKIIDLEEFTNILVVNKILYELIDKQMKNLSDDKLQEMSYIWHSTTTG